MVVAEQPHQPNVRNQSPVRGIQSGTYNTVGPKPAGYYSHDCFVCLEVQVLAPPQFVRIWLLVKTTRRDLTNGGGIHFDNMKETGDFLPFGGTAGSFPYTPQGRATTASFYLFTAQNISQRLSFSLNATPPTYTHTHLKTVSKKTRTLLVRLNGDKLRKRFLHTPR